MTDIQLPPFRRIHAAYVTSDLEVGQRRLAAMFGVDQFEVHRAVAIQTPRGEAMIDYILADADGTAVEAIQPMGGDDDFYRRVLPADPADIAFHHFASRITGQAEWDLVMAAAERHGVGMPVLGDSNGLKYAYLDTRSRLGHMLEYIWPQRPWP